MPGYDDRSNGRTSPYGPRRVDSRSSGSIHRSSKEEQRHERPEMRSDERGRFSRNEISSPTQTSRHDSSPRIPSGPSGPRGKSSTPRAPTASERAPVTTGTKPLGDVPVDMGSDRVRSPPDKSNGEFVGQDASAPQNPLIDVLACLDRFSNQLIEKATLSFEREKAKKECDRRDGEFEKTSSHHKNYPPISEQQLEKRDKARKSLEIADKKVAEKTAEVSKTMKLLALRMVSGGIDTTAINRDAQETRDQMNGLEKRFEMMSSEIVKTKETVSALDRAYHEKCDALQREQSSIRNEFQNLRAAVASDQANKTQLDHEKTTISIIAARMEGEMAKIRDDLTNATNISRSAQQGLQDLHNGPIRSLAQKVELVEQEARRKDSQLEQDHKLLLAHEDSYKKLIESQEQNSETLKSFGDLGVRLAAAEAKTNELQAAIPKHVVEDINGLRKRLEVLEARPQRPPPQVSTTGRSAQGPTTADGVPKGAMTAHNVPKVLDDLIQKIESVDSSFEQLRTDINYRFDKFQEDNDDVYATGIDQLNDDVAQLKAKVISVEQLTPTVAALERLTPTVAQLETNLEALKERYYADVQRLAAHQTAQFSEQGVVLKELQREVQIFKANPRPMDPAAAYAQNPTAHVRQTSSHSSPVVSVSNISPLGRQSGSPVVNAPELQLASKQVINKVEALELGVQHLNTRFNNLTTDALARQMWSQLDNVHPHLKDATKGVAKLEHSFQSHDGQLTRLVLRVDLLEQRSLPAGLKEALEKVDQNVTALGNRVGAVEAMARSLQIQINKVQEEMAVKSDANSRNLPDRPNGKANGDLSSSEDAQLPKRKATDVTNGNAKRIKNSSARRIVQDSDEDPEDQNNVLSDAHSS